MTKEISAEEAIWLCQVNLDAIGVLLDLIGPELEVLNEISAKNQKSKLAVDSVQNLAGN